MPAVSVKQRKFFGWAEHNPEQAKAEGVFPSGAPTHQQMHDFAATKDKGLPTYAPGSKAKKLRGLNL